MAYDLAPTREVSGGPWYTDHEADHELRVCDKNSCGFLCGSIGELYTRRYPHGGAGDQGVYRPVKYLGRTDRRPKRLLADSQLERLHASDGARFKVRRSAREYGLGSPRCRPERAPGRGAGRRTAGRATPRR